MHKICFQIHNYTLKRLSYVLCNVNISEELLTTDGYSYISFHPYLLISYNERGFQAVVVITVYHFNRRNVRLQCLQIHLIIL